MLQELNAAQRRGVAIETSKKMMSGGNRQHHAIKNTARLERFFWLIFALLKNSYIRHNLRVSDDQQIIASPSIPSCGLEVSVCYIVVLLLELGSFSP